MAPEIYPKPGFWVDSKSHPKQGFCMTSLSMRITELILTVILITFRYENQFLSLSYTVGESWGMANTFL